MAGKARFDKLLEPYHIGKVQTRNRIIKTAAGTGFLAQDSIKLGGQAKAYYEAIARGGVGLLIVEYPAIMSFPRGNSKRIMSRLTDEKYIPSLQELTQVIHKHGCPTFIQIYHSGPFSLPVPSTIQPVAASAMKIDSVLDNHTKMTRPMTVAEIEESVDFFGTSAVNAEKAGFDGVEINAASSHLLATFLSRFWNQRQDAYGYGSLESRARIVIEVIREIKKRLGKDFPVSILINGLEVDATGTGMQDKCMSPAECQGLARLLQEAGADAFHIRSHWLGNHVGGFLPEVLYYPEPFFPLKSFPKELDTKRHGTGANVPLVALIKKSVSVPIFTVGRLNPVIGETMLRQGKADFIGMNRRLCADPELPNKIASEKLDDIAPCTDCSGCLSSPGVPMYCRINAAVGTEDQYIIKPAEKKKRVLVIGGGPSGMEAARVAALRGHEVTLYEKTHRLGGLIPLAVMVKGTDIEDLPALVRYLSNQITKLGVRVKLGTVADSSVIAYIKPDVLIVAAGGMATVPSIPGINRRNVVSRNELHNSLKFYLRFLGPGLLRWLTRFWMPLGKNVVIIGGDIQGCQLAEFLVKRGRKVTIVDEAVELGRDMLEHARLRLLPWLKKKGVTMLSGVKYEEITNKGLTIITKEGKKQIIEADTIVPVTPLAPNDEFLKSLHGKAPEVYPVGDCREPHLIVDAIADGSRIARKI